MKKINALATHAIQGGLLPLALVGLGVGYYYGSHPESAKKHIKSASKKVGKWFQKVKSSLDEE